MQNQMSTPEFDFTMDLGFGIEEGLFENSLPPHTSDSSVLNCMKRVREEASATTTTSARLSTSVHARPALVATAVISERRSKSKSPRPKRPKAITELVKKRKRVAAAVVDSSAKNADTRVRSSPAAGTVGVGVGVGVRWRPQEFTGGWLPTKAGLNRHCFILQFIPSLLPDITRLHEAMWPEQQQNLVRSGW